LVPFFVFFQKIQINNPYDGRKHKSSSVIKPLINIPERIEGKYTRRDINQDNCLSLTPYRLINKKKKEATSFFAIRCLNKVIYEDRSKIIKEKTLPLFTPSLVLREFSCWELGQSPKKKKDG
jgi:hypothetical protein